MSKMMKEGAITKIASTLLVIVLLVGVSLPAIAQVGEQRHNLAVGINGGLNYNTVSFQPSIKQNSLMGINAGFTARYIGEKYFSMICGVQVELNYSQRGWDERIEDGTDNTYTHTMNYVEVPFLAHLAFGKERGGQFFLNLGPQMGYMISDKIEKGGNWNPENRVNEQYTLKIENKFDYGIVAAAGVEVRTKAGNFLVEGRYYYGLADFYKSTKKDYFSRSAHTTLTAKITYLFDLRK